MHIPPYHRNRKWQYIIVGVFFGGVIAYCTFIFMYGLMYERLLEENYDLKAEVNEIKSQNDVLLQDKKSMDEKVNEPITVNKIEITIANEKELKFDRLIAHQFEELIKEEINHLIGQDIEDVADSDKLLISTIENKAFTIDDFTYYFDIEQLMITKTIKVSVQAKVSK